MSKEMYCTKCGSVSVPTPGNRGNVFLLLILFVMLVIPGIIYLLYMLTGRTYQCKKCKSFEVVPTDSPVAMKALKSA